MYFPTDTLPKAQVLLFFSHQQPVRRSSVRSARRVPTKAMASLQDIDDGLNSFHLVSKPSDNRLALRAKPFGKDGVRLLFTGGAQGTVIEMRTDPEGEWAVHAEANEPEGVVIVKSSGANAISAPRQAAWRLRREGEASASVSLSAQSTSAPAASRLAPVLPRWCGNFVSNHRCKEAMLNAKGLPVRSWLPSLC